MVRKKHPENTAKHRRRATKIEKHDPSRHPVDQAYKGTQFDKRRARPVGIGDLRARRRAGCEMTEELIEDIGSMMDEGLPQYIVEAFLGLAEKRISNSIQRARKRSAAIDDWLSEAEGMSPEEAEKVLGRPCPEPTMDMVLEMRVRQAESEGEMTLIGALMRCIMEGDAKATMWMLERKFPQRWGRYATRTDLADDSKENAGADARAKLAAVLDTMRGALEA